MNKAEEISLLMKSKNLDNMIENEAQIKLLDNWDKIGLKKIFLKKLALF